MKRGDLSPLNKKPPLSSLAQGWGYTEPTSCMPLGEVLSDDATPTLLCNKRGKPKSQRRLPQDDFKKQQEDERKARAEESAKKQLAVLMRHEALQEEQQKNKENSAAEAHDKRQRQQVAFVQNQKREQVNQRLLLWMQTICVISPLFSLMSKRDTEQALYKLAVLCLPVIRVYIHKKRKAKRQQLLLKKHASSLERPSVSDLQELEFFDGWQTHMLSTVSETLLPVAFEKGECVCMEGDWGEYMYLFGSGHVDIYIRPPKVKSRASKDGFKVASIHPGGPKSVFGEFAVLCNEPRSATIIAGEDSTLWKLQKATVSKLLTMLRPKTYKDLIQKTDERRALNMNKLRPLKPSHLIESCSIFSKWPNDTLIALCTQFKPVVFRAGHRVIEQDEQGDALYILASGTVSVTSRDQDDVSDSEGESNTTASSASSFCASVCANHTQTTSPQSPATSPRVKAKGSVVALMPSSFRVQKTKPPRKQSEVSLEATSICSEGKEDKLLAKLYDGTIFGHISLFFPEPRCASVTTDTTCELWKLCKNDLMMHLSLHPHVLLSAKEELNKMRALWLDECRTRYWKDAPLLSTLPIPSKWYRQMVAWLTPCVIDATSILTTNGDPCAKCICIVKGKIKEVKSGAVHSAPFVIGVPDAVTRQPFWSISYKAITKCEIWECTAEKLINQLQKLPSVVQVMNNEEWHLKTLKSFSLPHQPFKPFEVERIVGDPTLSPSNGRNSLRANKSSNVLRRSSNVSSTVSSSFRCGSPKRKVRQPSKFH